MSAEGDLDVSIERAEARLNALEVERGALARELSELRVRRERASSDVVVARAVHRTQEEKLALFGSLFRGRGDVFASRWENLEGKERVGAVLRQRVEGWRVRQAARKVR